MPWSNNQGGGGGGGGWQGGGGGGRGPWRQGPGGPQQPPNLEELLQKSQDRVRRMMPGGMRGRLGLWVIILVVIGAWMFSGFYRVQPDEQGVVLRFGKWVGTTASGLNYHLPSPIESVLTPKVTAVNRIDIGFQSGEEFGRAGSQRDVLKESLMLTGDENIVDIHVAIFWKIKDAGKYLFNIDQPIPTVKAVGESAMREIIGRTPIQSALTEGRQSIEIGVQDLIQKTLDEYGAGIEITQVKMQKVDPPSAVIDAFRDVQAAEADRVRLQNEAEAYANDIIPRARGESSKVIQEAEAYKQQKIAESEGEAARYLAILKEYKTAKDVTSRRLYLETMEDVLEGMDKVILDNGDGGGGGVVPYLPLNELIKSGNKKGRGNE
jgi:membrane protease subunit HflK